MPHGREKLEFGEIQKHLESEGFDAVWNFTTPLTLPRPSYSGVNIWVKGDGSGNTLKYLLLADGLFTEETWGSGKPHLSAKQCAELARDAGVGRLVITHLNPFLDKGTLLSQARQAFPASELAQTGMCCRIGDEG